MDILGPFPPASGRREFVVVAIDYFTKRVEAKRLAHIIEQNIQTFFWKSVGIKKRLDEKAGRWAYELYHVLWVYRTTPRTTTGESPFNLPFGTEVVIPVDVGVPSSRVANFNKQLNGDGPNLDLLEKVLEESRIRVAVYKQKVSNYHDVKIRLREFRTGDFVLRKAAISQPKKVGKLSPSWEGPYRVKEIIRPRSYKLETLDTNPSASSPNALGVRTKWGLHRWPEASYRPNRVARQFGNSKCADSYGSVTAADELMPYLFHQDSCDLWTQRKRSTLFKGKIL
ncbi:uncharacterized protein LOC143853949 [Tasmannia lanceolata]|uniref:uncharacterized protein LOC143853949 n=1 Tax=Tasmannia lanceolata TaxID=3420 RepID=UPI004063DA4E